MKNKLEVGQTCDVVYPLSSLSFTDVYFDFTKTTLAFKSQQGYYGAGSFVVPNNSLTSRQKEIYLYKSEFKKVGKLTITKVK